MFTRFCRSVFVCVVAVLVTIAVLPLSVLAIKFELPAAHTPTHRCIWNYALADTLVVITVNAERTGIPEYAHYQSVDVDIVDGSPNANVYLSKRNVQGETRMAINTHQHADLGVCIKNTLDRSFHESAHTPAPSAVIDLDVDIGADAVDYNAIANQESLSGLETEMRKLEAVAKEIVEGMEYLKKREDKMRNTNDSTSRRVSNFGWLTLIALVGLGVWQITHLRGFFRRKYLID